MYFFRALFTDCTGGIEVGLSRKPAETLIQMTADKFKQLKDKENYLKENVFYRDVKMLAKVKDEQFKGEIHTRYYVQEAEFVEDVHQQNEDLIAVLKANDKAKGKSEQNEKTESPPKEANDDTICTT